MDSINQFQEIVSDPDGYAAKWKNSRKGKVAGFLCSYTPEEIITAGGILPFRIFGAIDDMSAADIHLQAYCCGLARGALAEALSGKLDFLDGIVFPHTCDTIQRLSDIWRLKAEISLHMDVVLPVKLNTASAREYMIRVLKEFIKNLETGFGVTITPERLSESIRLYNAIRNGLAELYELKENMPDLIPGDIFHTILKTSMIMDRNDFLKALVEILDGLKQMPPGKESSKKRIILSGGICSMPDIYGLIEDAGGTVIWDDLCTGSRYSGGLIRETGDPVEAIADRYLSRSVCPAKHQGIDSRGKALVQAVKEKKADGVIFLIMKFCDPHGFDYPYMKQMLDQEHIPNMLIEIEGRSGASGQLRTRCEAFLEMV